MSNTKPNQIRSLGYEKAAGLGTGSMALDILAAATTPFILFVSTTNSLYLDNQEDLAYQVSVLYPFLALFGCTWLVGFLLFRLLEFFQKRPLSFFIWAYMILGPFFLLFAVLNVRYPARMDSLPYYGGMLVLYMLTVTVLTLRSRLTAAKHFFAMVAVLFFILEGYQFTSQFGKGQATFDPADSVKVSSNRAKMPNIYHIVFDAYQTDLLEQTLTPKLREKLAEFRFFSDTTTPFGLTRMALASTFLGKSYAYDTPQIDYQRDAYNSKQSFLFSLVESGYDTHAIVHPIHAFGQTLFHRVVHLKDYADSKFIQDNWFLFRNLWLYGRLPRRIAALIIPPEDMVQMEKKNLLPDVAPIYSYSVFQKFLREEERMAPNNRYSFMHLILPHFPNVLMADGTFGPPLENGDIPKTSSIEQNRCVANMIVALIERLKSLDRFDDSLIIIQGDHGSGYGLSDTELAELNGYYSPEWHRARSRPVLLLKLAHDVDTGREFQVYDEEVSLFDIAPTILDSVKISARHGQYSGISLARPELPKERGKRLYHYFEKKGWHGWTDRMERYVIENSEIRREKDIPLLNNPKILKTDFL